MSSLVSYRVVFTVYKKYIYVSLTRKKNYLFSQNLIISSAYVRLQCEYVYEWFLCLQSFQVQYFLLGYIQQQGIYFNLNVKWKIFMTWIYLFVSSSARDANRQRPERHLVRPENECAAPKHQCECSLPEAEGKTYLSTAEGR